MMGARGKVYYLISVASNKYPFVHTGVIVTITLFYYCFYRRIECAGIEAIMSISRVERRLDNYFS